MLQSGRRVATPPMNSLNLRGLMPACLNPTVDSSRLKDQGSEAPDTARSNALPPLSTGRTAIAEQEMEAKEKELKDINKLRIDTLEHIIQEKMRIIEQMENKLSNQSFAVAGGTTTTTTPAAAMTPMPMQSLPTEGRAECLETEVANLSEELQLVAQERDEARDRIEELERRLATSETERIEREATWRGQLVEQRQNFEKELAERIQTAERQFKYYEKELKNFERMAKRDIELKEDAILFRKKLEDAQYQLERSNGDQQKMLGYVGRLKSERASAEEKLEIMRRHGEKLESQISEKNGALVMLEGQLSDARNQAIEDALALREELDAERDRRAEAESQLNAERQVRAKAQREVAAVKPVNSQLEAELGRVKEELSVVKLEWTRGKERQLELGREVDALEQKTRRQGELQIMQDLRLKQGDQEIRFVKESLRAKVQEAEGLSKAVQALQQRVARREEEQTALRSREDLQRNNQALLLENQQLKGELLVARQDLRYRAEQPRLPDVATELLKQENQQLSRHLKDASAQNGELRRELCARGEDVHRMNSQAQAQAEALRECREVVVALEEERKQLKRHTGVPQSVVDNLRARDLDQQAQQKAKIGELERHVVTLSAQLRKWVDFEAKSAANFSHESRSSLFPPPHAQLQASAPRPFQMESGCSSISPTLRRPESAMATLDERVAAIKHSLLAQEDF